MLAIAALLGCLLAVAELISRYRDDPVRAVLSIPAGVYVGINGIASAGALYLIQMFDWSFGISGQAESTTQVLVAGFGAAALFRSSFFNVTVGDQVVGVGPAAILTVILAAADRAVDRRRARIRFEKTSKIMDGIPFAAYAESLVMYCWAAMQNTSAAEIKAIEEKMLFLRGDQASDIPDHAKSLVLGLALQTVVGDRVLKEAAQRIRDLPHAMPGTPTTADHTAAGTADATQARSSTSKVIEIIKQHQPIPIRALQESSALQLAPFTRLLERLSESEVIVVSGEPGQETVAIAQK